MPEYLEAIPIDDSDGQPMRYSAERAVVYSVGPDLVDSGGRESEGPWRTVDPSYRIEF